MALDTFDEMLAEARRIGKRHGIAAAGWRFSPETATPTYARVLKGIDDGDSLILDSIPCADLSGQWADSYSSRDLIRDVEFDDATDNDGQTELCDAYEEAFNDAATEEVRRMCTYHLSK